MDDWAREHGEYANFICVCVQGADNGGAQMAQAMGKQMKLRNCVNGFIEHDEHMPSYGQLGCGGFIILDSEHRLVAKKTSAFMEVRELIVSRSNGLLEVHVVELAEDVFGSQRMVNDSRKDLNGIRLQRA